LILLNLARELEGIWADNCIHLALSKQSARELYFSGASVQLFFAELEGRLRIARIHSAKASGLSTF
jgi:hypothetical protein